MGREKRSTGIVIQFNDPKGYGFLKSDDGGENVFVHHSTIKSDGFRTLRVGDKVEFTLFDSQDQKSRATEVTGPDGSPISSNRRDNYITEGRKDIRTNSGGGYSYVWKTEGCYICYKSGHFARECPNLIPFVTEGNGFGGSTTCYSCGGVGHMARDCKGMAKEGKFGAGDKRGCFRCGEQGHFARECPNTDVTEA